MGAFELQDAEAMHHELDSRRLREERIIAFKVYDSCRKQACNIIQHCYLISFLVFFYFLNEPVFLL